MSGRHQVTLPVDAMAAAGFQEGDRLLATSPAPGKVLLEREDDALDAVTGDLTGLYKKDDLDTLRDEWG